MSDPNRLENSIQIYMYYTFKPNSKFVGFEVTLNITVF